MDLVAAADFGGGGAAGLVEEPECGSGMAQAELLEHGGIDEEVGFSAFDALEADRRDDEVLLRGGEFAETG